jgi:hypothetical protein
MDRSMEHRIRERAYEIWVANGQKNGEAGRHWIAAERELLAEMTTATAEQKPAAAARKPRSRATPTTAKPRARAAG